MEFKIQEFENKNLGKNIILKNMNQDIFLKIIEFIESLGLERNLEEEKEIENFVKEKNLSRKSEKFEYRSYKKENNELEIDYLEVPKVLSIRIKLDEDVEKRLLTFFENQ